MFTGLVEGTGSVTEVRTSGDGASLWVAAGPLAEGVRIGDSIAVSGCCLTVVGIRGGDLRFDLAAETLRRTWFGRLAGGTRVNLERALRVGDRLGGHIVQGHVDGLATVEHAYDAARPGELVTFRLQPEHRRYCVEKGSVALDGVSLTIASVDAHGIGIALIPHTAAVTTLGERRAGDAIHVELDVIARLVARLVEPYRPG